MEQVRTGAVETRIALGRAVRRLLRLAPEVHAALAARVGVGVTDLLALDHLSTPTPPGGVVDLGRRLGISSASATVLVDRLVRAGHVERIAHATDRRRTAVVLTEHAEDGVRDALGPLVGRLGELAGGLDEQAAAAVLRFLSDLCEVLEDFATTTSASASTGSAVSPRGGGRAGAAGGRRFAVRSSAAPPAEAGGRR